MPFFDSPAITRRVGNATKRHNQTDKMRSDSVLNGLEPFLRTPDWRLTTAELLYHMPDHPHVLQSYLWQKLDLAPAFPQLSQFLDFWRREIEAPLHSIRVASAALTKPAELRYANGVFTLH